ncbi:NAD(P)H-dependent oxidoreductase [Phytobacter sp. V91]|uniref:NAD(P)H-dependent oxidoreductase n=1 Tax=Phytobacter sp. V91 TaxID=3369425 RepID=UPI003F649114
MNILIVAAYPNAHSLNAALNTFAIQHLENAGHQVQVSDLYAMQWKSQLDANDSQASPVGEFYHPSLDSKYAFEHGTQSADITREQEKLRQADAVIFQFPLWWFSMPAIMKGWFDRVYACGFAYGVGEHSETHWGDRYGEGKLAGKRAMLLVTTGGWASHYGPRGINGPMDDILFPIQHGMLFYPGFTVLPPMVIYHTSKMTEEKFAAHCAELAGRLDSLWQTEPVPFRQQNAGDYSIPALTLRSDIAPDASGFGIHVR